MKESFISVRAMNGDEFVLLTGITLMLKLSADN